MTANPITTKGDPTMPDNDNAAQPEPPITEADFDTVPLADIADLAGRYITQELARGVEPEATVTP